MFPPAFRTCHGRQNIKLLDPHSFASSPFLPRYLAILAMFLFFCLYPKYLCFPSNCIHYLQWWKQAQMVLLPFPYRLSNWLYCIGFTILPSLSTHFLSSKSKRCSDVVHGRSGLILPYRLYNCLERGVCGTTIFILKTSSGSIPALPAAGVFFIFHSNSEPSC